LKAVSIQFLAGAPDFALENFSMPSDFERPRFESRVNSISGMGARFCAQEFLYALCPLL